MQRRTRRRAVVLSALVATAWVASLLPATADAVITIDRVNGRAVTDSARASRSRPVTIEGAVADGEAPLVADAGDSRAVTDGAVATLQGMAAGGTAPYEASWSSAAGAIESNGFTATIDTAGAPAGPLVVTLTVRDAEGRSASDQVVVRVGDPVLSTTIVDQTRAVGPGVPDEDPTGLGVATSGAVDGETHAFEFTLPEGLRSLDLRLTWDGTAAESDFDLYLEGPSPRYAADTSGASGGEEETMHFDAPEAGPYVARVSSFLTAGDTFRLVVTSTAPAVPLPTIRTAGPFRFAVTDEQRLTAEPAAGTAPLSVAWDLDQDGTFEASGTTATSRFPLGTRLVTAKVTDADGYEHRETVAVRVVAPGSSVGATPFVVIGINDTGINPYHREFAATTFPDRSILDATADFTRHPSEYLPGFPTGAPSLPVTLGKGFLPVEDCPDRGPDPIASADAIAATCAGGLWTTERIPNRVLHWIPGTKIIGARTTQADGHPILDDNGHGTGTASVSVGNAMGSCPTCLLVFNEGYYDDWMKDAPWIDVVSNSYGNINVTPDLPVNPFGSIDVKDAVERGQTWLFASGNGQGNAFVAPNTTYTQEHDRPDWIFRVGASDAGSRHPVIGDGNPADLSSYGDGYIPSASPVSDTAPDTFGGTSCATPITAGVFGLVLEAARTVLGDWRTGQRPGSVLAQGTPVGRTFLADGTLTRAELWDLILKTAQPSTSPATEASALSPTYPFQDLHYVFEGYGIADIASASRAIDVMLGRQALPSRPAEDEFFRRDSALRVAFDGSWSGYEEQYGTADGLAASFAGTAPAQVDTLPEALAVLDPTNTLKPSSARAPRSSTTTTGSAAASPGANLLASPVAGSTWAAEAGGAPVAGNAGVVPGTATRRFFPRRDGCGTDADNLHLSVADGPADGAGDEEPGDGCAPSLQPLSNGGSQFYFVAQGVYPAADGLPIAIDPLRPVTGRLAFDGTANGQLVVTAQLVHHGAIIGEQRTNRTVLPGEAVQIDLSFPVRPRFAGVPLAELSLRVAIDRVSGILGLSLQNPNSFVDVPLAPEGERMVELSVDDPTFTAGSVPGAPVDPVDGSWGRNLDVTALAPGTHTVYARLRDGTSVGAPVSTTFATTRVERTILVEVRKRTVAAGSGTTFTAVRSGSAWALTVPAKTLAAGRYVVVARSLVDATEVARSRELPAPEAGHLRLVT